jgi:hypothetical protein
MAGTGASGADSYERPVAGDGVVLHCALQRQRVAAGAARFYGELKSSKDAAAEVSTQNERSSFRFAGDEAWRRRGEGEIGHVDGVAGHLSEGGGEGKGGSAVGVGQRRAPVAVDAARVGRVTVPTPAEDQGESEQDGEYSSVHGLLRMDIYWSFLSGVREVAIRGMPGERVGLSWQAGMRQR